jgi:hypothetical protein
MTDPAALRATGAVGICVNGLLNRPRERHTLFRLELLPQGHVVLDLIGRLRAAPRTELRRFVVEALLAAGHEASLRLGSTGSCRTR